VINCLRILKFSIYGFVALCFLVISFTSDAQTYSGRPEAAAACLSLTAGNGDGYCQVPSNDNWFRTCQYTWGDGGVYYDYR